MIYLSIYLSIYLLTWDCSSVNLVNVESEFSQVVEKISFVLLIFYQISFSLQQLCHFQFGRQRRYVHLMVEWRDKDWPVHQPGPTQTKYHQYHSSFFHWVCLPKYRLQDGCLRFQTKYHQYHSSFPQNQFFTSAALPFSVWSTYRL